MTGGKVVVIGTGFGKHAAAPAYRSVGFDVEVVSPRDEAAVARSLQSDADLISVHSPPFLHTEHVLAAIERGRPVLCDKPFGRSAQEATVMRDRARDAGVPHFLNFEFRYRDSWTKLKQLADDGVIGTPTHLSWTWFGNGLRGRPFGWINDATMGGGWIGAYGSHLIDYTRWLFGSDVARCSGVTRIDDPQYWRPGEAPHTATAEDAYAAWFLLDNGCTATHDTGFAAAVTTTPRATLTGGEGIIELIADTTLVVSKPDTDTQTIECERPGRPDPALVAFFTDVAAALQTGTGVHTLPSFDDGVAAAEAMDQLRGSAQRRTQ